ncbi:MAG: Zn-ribbon domain-containing OB-fold protein [Candidatus Bathyarchaeota archaeon]|nr:Zn-ribbon domain-containing OB-fold protein [Candidatus Bathyarchaeota archaeon]MDH5787286.1 Zn-ribbon domain-containing OB-fold protein [Candidatus Bathyarchaeota archaeon]
MTVEFEKIKRQNMIKLPYMLDFYPLQDAKFTRIDRFFQNLKERKLTTTKCKACGKVLWPPRIMCPECFSENLEWINLGVDGELYAFTEMKLGAPLGFVEDVPFCIGLVKIGGLLISARIDGAKYEDLKIGDKVTLKIIELEDDRIFYRFCKVKE